MKNLLIILSLSIPLFLTSCCKEEKDTPFVPTPENSTTINLEIGYLTSDKPAEQISPTKAFEDEIKMYKLWIFKNSDDEALMFKEFTADEIKTMKAKIEVPKLAAGEKLTFISIANHKWFNHTTSKKKVLQIYDVPPQSYNANGSYSDLMTKSLNPEGFTMNSEDELQITTETTYTVKTKLQKVVSKIEVFVDNYYMREANKRFNNKDLFGIFQATRLTIKGDCNTSLFSNNEGESEVQGGAINTEEYKSTGVAYFGGNKGRYYLTIQLWGNNKNPGTLNDPEEYFTWYKEKKELKPNKHYIFHWTRIGSSCSNIVLDKIEEKDWVKTNN